MGPEDVQTLERYRRLIRQSAERVRESRLLIEDTRTLLASATWRRLSAAQLGWGDEPAPQPSLPWRLEAAIRAVTAKIAATPSQRCEKPVWH